MCLSTAPSYTVSATPPTEPGAETSTTGAAADTMLSNYTSGSRVGGLNRTVRNVGATTGAASTLTTGGSTNASTFGA